MGPNLSIHHADFHTWRYPNSWMNGKSNPKSKNWQSEIQESSQKHEEEEDEAVINAATLPHDHTAAVLTRRQSTESADARLVNRGWPITGHGASWKSEKKYRKV